MNSNRNNGTPNQTSELPKAICQTNQLRINDYLSRSINPSEYAALQSHLSICSACRSQLEFYTTLDRSLKQLPNPPTTLRLRRAVFASIAEAEANRHPFQPVPTAINNRTPRLAGSLVAAATLLVFAATFAMLLGGRDLPDTNVAYASPTVSIPSTVTPMINDAIKLGVSQQTPAITGTPLPAALLVSQASSNRNELMVTSVDSAGMTQTLASPAGKLVTETKAALSHDSQRVAFVAYTGDKAKLQVYDIASRKVIASVDLPSPSSNQPTSYKLAPTLHFSPDDKYLVYSATNEQTINDYSVLDLNTGITKPFAPNRSMLPNIRCCVENLVGWGTDNLVYIGSLGEGQRGVRLITFNPAGGQAKTPAPNYDLLDKPWMNDSDTAIYAASRTKLVRYDVVGDKYTALLDFADGEQLSSVPDNESGPQGIFAETADGSTLLVVLTTADGTLELQRIGLRGQFSDKLPIYLPPASSNPKVIALQVCASTIYYQISANDASGAHQTTLVAQPLNSGAATPLTTSGQLIGCTKQN